MKAFVFPGQGAQFVGMGKDLYENSALAKELFEKANDILGYRITDIMFNGTDEDLRQTKVTQPAVFLHSVISALCMGDDFKPEMTAGHSLGEFSALVAAGALSFEDGLKLVYARAMAMQKACEAQPSTMAAIIALPDEKVEEICAQVSAEGEVCVAANYNCPGQIVISGSIEGINKFCSRKLLKNSVDSPIRHARIGIAVVGLAVRVSIRRIYHATAVRLGSQVSRLDVIHHVNDHDKGYTHCRTDDGNSTEKGILADKS